MDANREKQAEPGPSPARGRPVGSKGGAAKAAAAAAAAAAATVSPPQQQEEVQLNARGMVRQTLSFESIQRKKTVLFLFP